ncbi:MAG: HAMP domain-containing protein, partial [Spirochaetaceae bacterium]|nr:HAMP domain-containing protein [Spirochaetaceae bacterium]
MKIRVKILLVVLPLLTVAVVMVGVLSYLFAAAAVNRLAVDFLNLMAEEVRNYADGQWNLLVDNNVTEEPLMENAAKLAVESFSRGVLRSDTQAIFALDGQGVVDMQAGPGSLSPEEQEALKGYAGSRDFVTIKVGGVSRVAYTIPFAPFSWQLFITEERSQFYGTVEQIFRTTLYILAAALIVGILILLIMAKYLTNPMEALVAAMWTIIESNNLNESVRVYYNDEVGRLAETFNLMLKNLSVAYEQVKQYAFDAAVAQKREMKIRNV